MFDAILVQILVMGSLLVDEMTYNVIVGGGLLGIISGKALSPRSNFR